MCDTFNFKIQSIHFQFEEPFPVPFLDFVFASFFGLYFSLTTVELVDGNPCLGHIFLARYRPLNHSLNEKVA